MHAVLDGGMEMILQPGLDFTSQRGDVRLRNPLLQTIKPVAQGTDAHGNAKDIIPHLLQL